MLAAPGATIDVAPGTVRCPLLANIVPGTTFVVEPGEARFVAP